MVAPEPLPDDVPRWVSGLWVGLLAAAVSPLAATYAWVGAGIHRPENQAIAQALAGVLGALVTGALALSLWRLGARIFERLPGGVLPHGVATVGLAAWLAPAAAPALLIATGWWWWRS